MNEIKCDMYDIENIVEKYLGSAEGYQRKSAPEERSYYCPKCGWKNPRLIVNYEKNMFHCWYCNWGGQSITNILYQVKADRGDIKKAKITLGEKEKDQKVETQIDDVKNLLVNIMTGDKSSPFYKKYHINDDGILSIKDKSNEIKKFKRVFSDKSLIAKRPRKYLKSRGVSLYEMDYYNIFHDGESILFPNFDGDKNVTYWVKRSISSKFYEIPDAEEVKKSDIIFFDHLVDYKSNIILTEGIFDAIRVGYNAIPLLGTFINKTLLEKLIDNNTPNVIVMLDSDADRTAIKLAKHLYSYDINTWVVTDYGYKDPGSIPKEKISSIIYSKKTLHIKNIDLTISI